MYQLNQRRATMYLRCKKDGCHALIRTNHVYVQDLMAVPQIIGNNAPVHYHGDKNDRSEKIELIQQMKDIIIQRPTIAAKTEYNEVVTRLHQHAGATGHILLIFRTSLASIQRFNERKPNYVH